MSAPALTIAALIGAMALTAAQQPEPEPRFRGGANLVRLDVYVSQDGTPVTDLTPADFEVLEDNAPQAVTSFEFVRARGAVPDSARIEPTSVAESRARASRPDTRLFVLFLDTLHVQLEGSYRAKNPVAELLDRVIGQDDLVGVMTPEMSARNMTYSPLTGPVAQLLSSNWAWGERGSASPTDPREGELLLCYPDNPESETQGLAKAIIERRREQRTLTALGDLLNTLERQRDDRTFVLLLTEGWTLPGPDNTLARPLQHMPMPGGPVPVGVGSEGRLTTGASGNSQGALASCERERALIAHTDFRMEFQQLMQRANRANVSFYPIDPRGLVAFDDPIGPARPAGPAADLRRLNSRQDGLRALAAETDGTVVLNTDIDRALPRLLTDIGSYYLLGYVSTNQKLDGRYRRLTVRVTRPGATVRARPGYLAPTAAEARQGGSSAPAAAAQTTSRSVEQALSRLPGGRSRPAMYMQVAGGAGYLQVNVEVDRTTLAAPEWANGATLRVEIGAASGLQTTGQPPRHVEELTLEPGKRLYSLRYPERDLLAPGTYQIRAQATATGSRSSLTVSALGDVPAENALIGATATAARRGPGTGRMFEPTADPRFRRTERLMVETPIVAGDATVSARLLNRLGQPMAVPVTTSERIDESLLLRVALAEVGLAPLAPGEYVVEVTAVKDGVSATTAYAFRIIP